MHMRILRILPPNWIVRYIEKLIMKVFCISNTMFVISVLPKLSLKVFANRKRKSAFDELHTSLQALVRCRRQ